MAVSTTKRDALLRYLESGDQSGYTPAAFFLHFGEGYKFGKTAVDKHCEFFRFTGMDFVKIQFELDFPRVEVANSRRLRELPQFPAKFFEPQLEVVKGLVEELKSEALVVLTLYSPFMILNDIVGAQNVIRYAQDDPESTREGLESIAKSLLGFVRECAKIGLDGFYHSTQGGEKHRFDSAETFHKLVKPIDLKVMGEIGKTFPFNILHICDYHEEYGGYADLGPFLDYPGQVVNVTTEIGGKSLSSAEISKIFGRPYMGGMNRLGPLATGSEQEVRAAARQALAGAPARFILGADCTVPANTPWESLRAAIEEAHRP